MSISSDGIFFYGMIWKDSEPPWREASIKEREEEGCDELSTNPEWEDLYCLRSGKEIKDCPVELRMHYSYGAAGRWFLGVEETVVQASHGWPEKAKTVTEKPEWRSQLEQFCVIMGIEWQEPAWWVTSIYG